MHLLPHRLLLTGLLATATLPALPGADGDLPLGHPDFVPSVEHPVGWRGDGNGAFPGATPPTVWSSGTVSEVVEEWKHPKTGAPRSSSHLALSDDKAVTIAWQTAMPGWAQSSPIVVGDRVFTTAEPDFLVCVDARSGEILWQRRNIVFELDGLPANEAAARDAYLGELYAARVPIAASIGNYQRLPSPWTEEAATTVLPRIELTIEILDELVAKGPHGDQAAAAREAVRAGYTALENAKPGDQTEKMGRPILQAITSAADWLEREHGVPAWIHWDGFLGWTFATPCSDGSQVYASMGQGQVVCYDLDGKRKWALLHKPKAEKKALEAGARHVPSPMLADGVLVAQMLRELIGVDTTTGRLLWVAPISVSGYGVSSHKALRLSSGRWVVATSAGAILDAKTGKEVGNTGVRAYGSEGAGSSLVGTGDIVAYIGAPESRKPTAVAYKLIDDGTTVRCETLFAEDGRAVGASPILHDGFVHFLMRSDRKPNDTYELTTGKAHKGVAWRGDELGGASPILAGDVIILPNDGKPLTVMKTYSLTAPAGLKPISTTNLVHRGGVPRDPRTAAYTDRFVELDCWDLCGGLPDNFGYGSPFAHSSHIYVRSLTHLICIGN